MFPGDGQERGDGPPNLVVRDRGFIRAFQAKLQAGDIASVERRRERVGERREAVAAEIGRADQVEPAAGRVARRVCRGRAQNLPW